MRKNIRRIAAAAMAAVMTMTVTPDVGIVYADVIPGEQVEMGEVPENLENLKNLEQEEQALEIASDSNAEYSKASDSNADYEEPEEDALGEETKKILSWKWNDPEGSLIDGQLLLSVTEEDQISFDDVVSMLPERITAEIADVGGYQYEEELPVTGWTCAEYVQNLEDRWPTAGTYVFAAETSEDYCLESGVKALEVNVVLENPGVAVLAAVRMQNLINIDGGKLFELDTNQSYKGNGYTVTNHGNDNYSLVLSGCNYTAQLGLTFLGGSWDVTVTGENTITGTTYGMSVTKTAKVTMSGSGTLNLKGSTDGIAIDQQGELTIDNAGIKINVTGGNSKVCSGISVIGLGKLEIKNGKVKATGYNGIQTGSGRIDSWNPDLGYSTGTIIISDGNVTAEGSNGGAGVDILGTLTVSGGTLEIEVSDNYNYGIKIETNSTVEITGDGHVTTANGVQLYTESSGLNVKEGGTLVTGNIQNDGTFVLGKEGKLTLNGEYRGKGTFTNEGGMIDGTGSLGDDKKVARTFTYPSGSTPSAGYSSEIDVSSYFDITPAGENITYILSFDGIDAGQKGEGTLEGTKLTVTKAGKFKITASVEKTNLYQAATGSIVLTVTKSVLLDEMIRVMAYSGTYDGTEHPAVSVTMADTLSSENFKITYAEMNSTEGGETYQADVPKVKDVADSGKKYRVLIQSDIYADKVINSGAVSISQCDMNFVRTKLSEVSVVYNQKEQEPQVVATIGDNGYTLQENVDYTVSYEGTDGVTLSENEKPINAGTYWVTLTAVDSGNFSGSVKVNRNFIIEPKELIAKIKGNLEKVYDGTTDGLESQGLYIELYMDGNKLVDDSVKVKDGVSFTYTEITAGTGKLILAKDIALEGTGAGNYQVGPEAETDQAVILPAQFTKVEVTQRDPLTYNGEEQTAVALVDVRDINDSIPELSIIYATERDGRFTEEVPAFTDAGTYTVYYRVTAPNYEEKAGSFPVTIGKLSLDSDQTSVELAGALTYAGVPQQQPVSVKVGELELSADDYEVKYQKTGTEEWLDSILDAGSYTMQITGVGNYEGSKCVDVTVSPADLAIAGGTIEKKIYDGTAKANVTALKFTGICGNDSLKLGEDYTVTTAEFTDVNAGTGKIVRIAMKMNDTATTRNYEIAEVSYELVDQVIEKAAAPVFAPVQLSYSIDETGKKTVEITGLPEDCGEYLGVSAAAVSDEIRALNPQVSVAGKTVTFELLGNKKENVGKTSEILVSGIATQNYEDAELRIQITMEPGKEPEKPAEDNGNSADSGNNGGNGNSNGGNTNSGSTTGGNTNSGSGKDSSKDRTMSAAGKTANAGTITNDRMNGYVSSTLGIITGTTNSSTQDGYSHWMKDEHGWWLRLADGSYPKAEKAGESGTSYQWIMVNGKWWPFDENGYIKTGWLWDTVYQGWFYVDANLGMRTGWIMVDGIWYYLNPASDGTRGILYTGRRTPDGYYVREDGSWDGVEKQ